VTDFPIWASSNREHSLPVCELTDLPRLMCSCAEHDGWAFDFDDLEPSEHAMFAADPEAHAAVPRMTPRAIPEYQAEPWCEARNVDVEHRGETCRVCAQRPAGDAFLCAECVDDLSVNLGDVPALLADLEVLTSREARQSVRRKKNRAEHTRWDDSLATDASGVAPGLMLAARGFNRVPFVPPASTVMAEIGTELTTTVRALTEARKMRAPQTDHVGASRWLLVNVQTLAVDVHGPDFARNLAKLHARAMSIIDNEPEGIPLGPCDQPECRQAMFANPNERDHPCEKCGATYVVADRLEARRDRIRKSLLAVDEILRFVASDPKTFAVRVTEKQLARWINQGRLVLAGHRTDDEAPTYRAGDVADLAEEMLSEQRKSLSLAEVSSLLDVPLKTLYRWQSDGIIKPADDSHGRRGRTYDLAEIRDAMLVARRKAS
jgi:hypothetical protein